MARLMKTVLFVLLSVGLGSGVSLAGVTTINVTPQGDGYYHDESGRSYDYYNSDSTGISAHYQFWGFSSDVVQHTGYTQFDLTNAPATTAIDSVFLYLNITSAYKTGSTATAGNIKHVANSSGATGNASQKLGGSEWVGNIMPGMEGRWNAFDVTALVLNDIDSGYNWSAFSYHYDASGDYSNRFAGYSFTSAESGIPAYLCFASSTGNLSDSSDVPAVPVPGAFLLGSLGVGVVGWRRHRKTL